MAIWEFFTGCNAGRYADFFNKSIISGSKFAVGEVNGLIVKQYITLCLLLFSFLPLNAQDSLGSIGELQRLLNERNLRFGEYVQSAEKKSGIFGNKTKKDLEQSREILLEIVKTDEEILSELNRAIQRRGMAKVSYTFDEMEYRQTIDQLVQASDTLEKQLVATREIHASLQKKYDVQKMILYGIAATFAVFIILIFLRRKHAPA